MFRTVSLATLMAPLANADSFFSYSTEQLMESFAYGAAARSPLYDDGHQTTPSHLRLVSVSTSPRPRLGT